MKTWETLFQLTSFMKYLLSEVLPGEKVDSPSYVLHSLFELLKVTENCIDLINNDLKNMRGDKICRSDKKYKQENEEFSHRQNDQRLDLESSPEQKKGDMACPQSVPDVLQKSPHEEQGFLNQVNFKEGINIPVKFEQLSKEMINGRPYGYYCKICNLIIYSVEVMEKHKHKSHITYSNEYVNKIVNCNHCNLGIFPNDIDSEQLILYHEQRHFESSKKCNVTNYPNKDGAKLMYNKMNKSKQDPYLATSVPYLQNQCNTEIKPDNFRYKDLSELSGHDRFLKLNSGNERSIINSPVDNNVIDDEDHYSRENLSSPSNDSINSSDYIVKYFRNFDSYLHESNMNGCFYCRPCNEGFNIEEHWRNHCLQQKHLNLMGNWKYKNFIGKCNYCSLTIVATERALEKYMVFHTRAHKKPPLFDKKLYYATKEEKKDANRAVKPKIFTKTYDEKRKNSIPRSHSSKISNSDFIDRASLTKENRNFTFDGDDGSAASCSYEEENLDISCTAIDERKLPLLNTKSNIHNKNPPTDINTKNIDSIILQLINSKREEIKYEQPEFCGFCVICELKFSSAFSWEDHLVIDENHSKRIRSTDSCVTFQDLNLTLFGDGDDLAKYEKLN